ncbi:MAG: protein-L-isoaspartate(D-aspartate) O-methyltransferase [Deltaproteobacteria bacterium]|nr:MAG: protein-L-isoaspartate(D-aspartate) O-methyltransferase [Deltaproteobacteria bacterium]
MEGLLPQPLEGPLVRRLIEQGIRDSRVLAAFGRVPRRFFVPDDAQLFSEGDHPLEIGYGQTISQPYIVAAMTEALQLEGNERVLEVGTGSGYQTAILCELLPLASIVRTIEIVPELSWRAQRTLKELGYENVEFRVADGSNGWPEAAPFDAILVAAAPEVVPRPLLEQLAPGGRLVIPVGPDPDHQELQFWRKIPGTGAFDRKVLMHVRFVPLTGDFPLH